MEREGRKALGIRGHDLADPAGRVKKYKDMMNEPSESQKFTWHPRSDV